MPQEQNAKVLSAGTMLGQNTVDPFTAQTVTVDKVSYTFGPNEKKVVPQFVASSVVSVVTATANAIRFAQSADQDKYGLT